MVKNLLVKQKAWFRSLTRKDSLEKERQPTPVFLSGESRGQRSLVESDRTEPTESPAPPPHNYNSDQALKY